MENLRKTGLIFAYFGVFAIRVFVRNRGCERASVDDWENLLFFGFFFHPRRGEYAHGAMARRSGVSSYLGEKGVRRIRRLFFGKRRERGANRLGWGR